MVIWALCGGFWEHLLRLSYGAVVCACVCDYVHMVCYCMCDASVMHVDM